MQYSFEKTFTQPLTEAVIIEEGDRVIAFSIQVVSGTCTILGGARFRGEPSEAITIAAGGSYTETASPYSFLSGTTITPIGGTTNISLKR